MKNRKESYSPTQTSFIDEIIVDNFAGGGGASTGIELAAGRPVAIAINHDPDAILLHKTNHPYTEHLQASVWDVDPVEVCKGRPVGLAWFSPDCKHFSKAKGSALVDRNIRGLAWIVLRWAAKVRPRVIMLENVEEFQTWGPVRKGKPIKKKAGQTFRKWKQQLEDLGYVIEHRELVAADYGAPTTRKRFVLVARCDGKPIVWPERTHAPRDSEEVKSGKLKPWRSAAEIIDWTLPSYSIFDTKEQIKEKYGVNAIRPLADNTMKRVICGVDKHTLKSASPFIVQQKFNNPAQDINNPLSTITSVGAHGLVNPVIAPFGVECNHSGGGHINDLRNPLNTITGKHTGGMAQSVMVPWTVTNTSNSIGSPASEPVHTITSAGNQILASASLMCIGQTGGGDRIRDIREPVPTIVSKQEACLLSANLIQYHTEKDGEIARTADLQKPIPTIDAANRHGLVTAQLVEYYGNGQSVGVSEPLHTVTSHDRDALALAHIQKFYGGVVGSECTDPLPTVTAIDHNALCAAHVVKFKGQELGTSPAEPLPTITAQSCAGGYAECRSLLVKVDSCQGLGHWPEIRALLNQHCGYQLQEDEIILLIIRGVAYFIADILLRMLTPRELYNAMGFPPDYIIDVDHLGKPYPKSKQVARCGNAVCPPMARAMVQANFPEYCVAIDIKTLAQFHKQICV